MSDSPPLRRRLFVAVALPDAVRAHLALAVERVRGQAAGLAGADGPSAVRWANPATWHLTLVFCGGVGPDEEAVLVGNSRRATARRQPLQLALASGGRFGNRVLWVGVGGDRAALVALAGSVAKAARTAGIAVEDRPYRPHLTIARGRPGADLAAAAAALGPYAGPTWVVDDLVLVESVLGAGPDGTARHSAVAAFPLG